MFVLSNLFVAFYVIFVFILTCPFDRHFHLFRRFFYLFQFYTLFYSHLHSYYLFLRLFYFPIIFLVFRIAFRWSLAVVLTRQNMVPLPKDLLEKIISTSTTTSNHSHPALVPGNNFYFSSFVFILRILIFNL